jgi:hypothetical protein
MHLIVGSRHHVPNKTDNKVMAAFRVAPALLDAMRRIRDRRGVPQSVQLDFALRAWLKKVYGVTVRKGKAASRSARTQRKASKRKQR